MPFEEIEGDDSYPCSADFSGTPFRVSMAIKSGTFLEVKTGTLY